MQRLLFVVILAVVLAALVPFSPDNTAICVADTGIPNTEETWIKNPANNHYYALTKLMSWTEAEVWAQDWGGHLATLRSWEEELWIKDTFGRVEYFWIGFNEAEEEGDWVWSSGEPVVYTNWDEGQPDDCWGPRCGPEDVAVINFGGCEQIGGQWYCRHGDHWDDYSISLGICRGVAEFETIPWYTLSISSTTRGSVTIPGEGEFLCKDGTVVDLEVEPDEGYQSVEWSGDVDTIADVEAASTTITMNDDYSLVANFEEIPPSPTGCFIATAAYGTPLAEEIQILREFRDEYLLTNSLGQALLDVYYTISPPIADFITNHPSLKPMVRASLMPVVAVCSMFLDTIPQLAGNEA